MTTERHLTIAELPTGKPTRFTIEPDRAETEALVKALEIEGLRKARLQGEIKTKGKRDWLLTAKLGATVIQNCAITLAPITTRIDIDLRRIYAANIEEPDAAEVEMSIDADIDPLPEKISLLALLEEELRLEIPAFVRAEGAELGALTAAPEGAPQLDDDAAKPFAALASLRAQMDDTE